MKRYAPYPLKKAVLLSAITLAAVLAVQVDGIADETLRTAVLDDKWYAPEAHQLKQQVEALLVAPDSGQEDRRCRAGAVPLGRYEQTGSAIGTLVGKLPEETRRVVVLTTWHPTFDHLPQDRKAMSGKASIVDKKAYETPLGQVSLDEAAQRLRDSGTPFAGIAATHYWEAGIEALLPFLQCHLKRGFTLVPVVLDAQANVTLIADALDPLLEDERTCLVVTSRLLNAKTTPPSSSSENRLLKAVLEGDDSALADSSNGAATALRILVEIARRQAWSGRLPRQTPNLGPPTDHTAIAFFQDSDETDLLQRAARAEWKDPATKAAFIDALQARQHASYQGQLLAPQEQQILLALARKTIAAKLNETELPTTPLYSDYLAKKRGCFITLLKDDELRGCLGTIKPTHPLSLAVQRYAIAAAFEDKRFKPVTAEELPELTIEISVLTAPQILTYNDADDLLAQLQPGVHGVMLTDKDNKQATYLPQVWDQIPRKDLFLSNLCRKGGMPVDTWKKPADMVVETYEVFAFDDAKNQSE